MISLPIRYLGIPLGANPSQVETWQPVLDKVRKKLSSWKLNILSKAGRVVLIKFVLNNLPMYYLGLFRMPKAVAKEIISIQRRFFWGKREGHIFQPLMKWEIIQMPKK